MNNTKEKISELIFGNVKIRNIENQINNRVIPAEYALKIDRTIFSQKGNADNLFPYNIWINNDNHSFNFRIAIIQNFFNKNNSLEDGIVIYGHGDLSDSSIALENYIKWQDKYTLKILIDKYNDRIIENEIIENEIIDNGFNNVSGRTFEENKYFLKKPLMVNKNGCVLYGELPLEQDNGLIIPENGCKGMLVYRLVAETFFNKNNFYIYCDVHHINGISTDNKLHNLLMVSMEQHASIEQFMWNKYYINENSFLISGGLIPRRSAA
jgi:hypothetical protein